MIALFVLAIVLGSVHNLSDPHDEPIGNNGTLGPYGITKDGTPIFDAQIYTKEDIEKIQGGYGPGYGVAKYPWQSDQPVVNVPCQDMSPGICGAEGPMGCSGNPNPPTADDIWKYKHGEFTPRQGDIMLESCYSPSNMAAMNADNATIIITQANGTQIELKVFKNGTITN